MDASTSTVNSSIALPMDGSTLLGDNLTFSSNTTVVGRDVTTLLSTTINFFHEAKFCINIGEKATTFLDCNLPAGECVSFNSVALLL